MELCPDLFLTICYISPVRVCLNPESDKFLLTNGKIAVCLDLASNSLFTFLCIKKHNPHGLCFLPSDVLLSQGEAPNYHRR